MSEGKSGAEARGLVCQSTTGLESYDIPSPVEDTEGDVGPAFAH